MTRLNLTLQEQKREEIKDKTNKRQLYTYSLQPLYRLQKRNLHPYFMKTMCISCKSTHYLLIPIALILDCAGFTSGSSGRASKCWIGKNLSAKVEKNQIITT